MRWASLQLRCARLAARMADCDVFRHCTCLRWLGHIMIPLVLAFVGVVWWAVAANYAPHLAGHGGGAAAASALVLASFSGLTAMVLWSYLAAVATDPGQVPAGWHPFAGEEEEAAYLERLHFGLEAPRGADGQRWPRYCRKCKAWKPARAHHCSVARQCVLRMDHYCLWVVNTVGLLNYKAFLLFLIYAWLACAAAACLLLGSFVEFFSAGGPSRERGELAQALEFLAFVLALAFALSLTGFLIMHARLVAKNCTTIEMYEKQRYSGAWPYDKGVRRNFEEVFGASASSWWLPVLSRAEREAALERALRERPSACQGAAQDVETALLA